MSETTKQRIDREIREEMARMKPEVDDISVQFEKLRTEYHKKCDEVVAARENAAKAMEERDAALVKLSKIRKQLGGLTKNTAANLVRASVEVVIEDIIGPDPLLPCTHSGTAATRST